MVRKNWLLAVIGLGLVACGGSDDENQGMDPSTGNTTGGTSGGTGTGSTAGTGGTTSGGTTGGAACTDGGTQACTCPDGTASTQTCAGGAWGACTCTTCPQPPIKECACPDGSMGGQVCMNGTFGECMCIEELDAGAERECPTGFTCQATGSLPFPVPGLPAAFCVSDTAMGPLPPMCTTAADCTTAGLVDVACSSVGGFLQICLQACPAP